MRPLAAATGGAGSWLVIGDTELGSELGRGLAHGTDRDTLRAALADVDNVLFAPESAGSLIDVASAYDLFNEARALVEVLVSMPSAPRLHILTRNAQPVAEGDRANAVHACTGVSRDLGRRRRCRRFNAGRVDRSTGVGRGAGR